MKPGGQHGLHADILCLAVLRHRCFCCQASKDLATMAEALQLKDSVIAVRDRELTEARDKVQEKELRLAEMSNE